MNAHTPGPWQAERDDPGLLYIRAGNEAIALLQGHDGIVGTEADARLIAAAPELLEALKQALAADRTRTVLEWHVRASAAIKKATGKAVPA